MRFRLSSYFLVCGVILSASLLLENFVFGVAYLLAIIPLFVFVVERVINVFCGKGAKFVSIVRGIDIAPLALWDIV